MACKVVVTVSVEKYLDAILYSLVEYRGTESAGGFLAAFDELVANIERFPEMYPLSQEPRLQRRGYRKALLGNHIVLYRFEVDTAAIAHVFHQCQDYARLV